MLQGKRIGLVGAGSMAQALLHGLVGGGLVGPQSVTVSNRANDEMLMCLERQWGVRVTRDKAEVAGSADVLLLAVKPADMTAALAELRQHVRPEQLVISMAAGIPTAAVEHHLPAGTPVVRAMPNTSSRVKASATALCGGRWAGEESLALARAIFASVGQVAVVPESALDAVTGLSGSGPAYVYLFVEALVEAGIATGLGPEDARSLAVQTLFGAARMLMETGADPAELRRQVTSPNGTTAAALQVLEEQGFKDALVAAVVRAAERAGELAQLAAPSVAPPAGAGEAVAGSEDEGHIRTA